MRVIEGYADELELELELELYILTPPASGILAQSLSITSST